MQVAIIDYGSGNLRSAAKAFEREAVSTGQSVIVTSDPAIIAVSSHIVLPGVGAFADCMRGLQAISGMRDALEREILKNRKPFLGICVGMQMLFETGHEHGVHKGLGWIEGEVVKIESRVGSRESGKEPGSNHSTHASPLKIPHMGWNDLALCSPDHPLLTGIKTGAHAYFVHSYHAVCNHPADVIATTDYGTSLTAIVTRGNIMGTQFHPEKSQETGLRLIGNFLRLASPA